MLKSPLVNIIWKSHRVHGAIFGGEVKLSRVFYIYDSRNIALFKSKNKKKLSYFEYLDAIENKAQECGISGADVEKGIFAFSKNYFDIEFNLKNSIEYKEDISEARSLSNKSNI